MKKFFLTYFFFLGFAFYGFSQFYVNTYQNVGRNPLELNQDFEQVNTGYQTVFPFWQSPREIYFPWRGIPFNFVLGTDTVTRFRVSNTGAVSFGPGPLAPVSNGRIPSPLIATQTISIWGIKQKGGNDAVFSKTFGFPPFRQHWIYFHSFSVDTTSLNNDANWAVVLCETSNHIYIVDMGSYQSPQNLTVGIQIDSLSGSELRGSPFINPQLSTNIDSYTPEDNTYYEFIPGSRKAYDLDLTQVEVPNFVKVGQPFSYEVQYRDLGTDFSDTICFSYQINQSAAVYTDTIFLPTATNRFYREANLVSQWVPSAAEQSIEIKYWIHDGRGNMDQNYMNDTLVRRLFTLAQNRWPKKYLLESHESALLAYGPESKLNLAYAHYRNPNLISVAWHNDSLFKDSMFVPGANRIGNYFNMIFPEGSYDRQTMPSENSINLPTTAWANVADSLSPKSSPCKVDVFGTLMGGQLQLNALATFTDNSNSLPKRLTVLLIEDSVSGIGNGFDQVNFFNNQIQHPFWNYGNPISNYVHRYVVRDYYPSNNIWGLQNLIDSVPVLDSAYEYRFTANLDPSWDLSNLSLVAFVSNHDHISNNRSVINATSVRLNDLVTYSAEIPMLNQKSNYLVFPNPINSNRVNVKCENCLGQNVQLELYTKEGRLVKAEQRNFNNELESISLSGLSEGIYWLRISDGSHQETVKLIKL